MCSLEYWEQWNVLKKSGWGEIFKDFYIFKDLYLKLE